MERYGKEQIKMPLVVSGEERPPKLLESYEINDGKAATIEETVVKEAESWDNWGNGKDDGQAKPVNSIHITWSNSIHIPYDKKKTHFSMANFAYES